MTRLGHIACESLTVIFELQKPMLYLYIMLSISRKAVLYW